MHWFVHAGHVIIATNICDANGCELGLALSIVMMRSTGKTDMGTVSQRHQAKMW
jgi:hypothetical protein